MTKFNLSTQKLSSLWRIVSISYLFLILIFFAPSIIWLISFWTANMQNIFGLVIFCGFAYLIASFYKNNRISFHPEVSVIAKGLIISYLILDLINRLFFDFSIISALLFFSSLTTLMFSSINFHNKSEKFTLPLLMTLSLPIVFYINATFGLIFRKVYALGICAILNTFYDGVKIVNTSIYKSDIFFNIDTGCSGVMNMYLLLVLCIFLSLLVHSSWSKTLMHVLISWVFFIFLNFIHLFIISYSYLVGGYPSIDASHGVLANIVTILTFSFCAIIFIKVIKPKKVFNSQINKEQGTLTTTIFSQSKLLKKTLTTILIFLLLIKYFFIIVDLDNKGHALTLNGVRVQSSCSLQMIPVPLNDKQNRTANKSLLKKFSRYHYSNGENSYGEIIVGETTTNLILSSVPTLLRDTEFVKFTRTINVNKSLQIRTIELNNNDIVYYYLLTPEKRILEFNPLDTIFGKREIATFIMIIPNGSNSDIESLINPIEQCFVPQVSL